MNKMHITVICVYVEIVIFLLEKHRVPNSDLRDMLSVRGQWHKDNYNIYQCSLSVYHTKLLLHLVVSKYIILEVRETKHFPSSWNWELSLDFLPVDFFAVPLTVVLCGRTGNNSYFSWTLLNLLKQSSSFAFQLLITFASAVPDLLWSFCLVLMFYLFLLNYCRCLLIIHKLQLPFKQATNLWENALNIRRKFH